MSHHLFHLLHLFIHVGHHLTKSSHTTAGVCRKCQTTSGPMFATNCCQARLCESCKNGYVRECVRTCTFCGENVSRK